MHRHLSRSLTRLRSHLAAHQGDQRTSAWRFFLAHLTLNLAAHSSWSSPALVMARPASLGPSISKARFLASIPITRRRGRDSTPSSKASLGRAVSLRMSTQKHRHKCVRSSRLAVRPADPSQIHEGGELGYALAVAYGSVFDAPDRITVAIIGDGESETGPTATAWHAHKFLDPAESGAVIPVLHANGFVGDPEIRVLR